jgi:nucleotide-binding universal stress UspA family protein
MKKILVPTDFSENAFKALRYAANLAARCGAEVHMVHAYTLLENVFVDKKSMRDAWNEQQLREKGASLLTLKQSLSETFPHVHTEMHLFTGPTEDVLLQCIDNHNIDLVVMGTQGASGLAEVLVGSTTATIMGKSKVPVLGIPRAYKEERPSAMVLATKGFERDKLLLDPVFMVASLFDIPTRVLIFAADEDSDVEIIESKMQLEAYVAFLRKAFPLASIEATLVEGEDFETALEDYCEDEGIGILCMLTYKRSFWDSIFNPSLTRQIAYHTKIPLLAVPVSK